MFPSAPRALTQSRADSARAHRFAPSPPKFVSHRHRLSLRKSQRPEHLGVYSRMVTHWTGMAIACYCLGNFGWRWKVCNNNWASHQLFTPSCPHLQVMMPSIARCIRQSLLIHWPILTWSSFHPLPHGISMTRNGTMFSFCDCLFENHFAHVH